MICDEVFLREVEACERTLYRISRTLLRSEADCCDAVQEALMKAWQHRNRIDENRFRAYLTRILINECHNIGRKRARVIVMESVPEQPAPQEIRQDIREALMQVDEAYRLLLVMYHIEGFTLQEIAHALHIPLGTVKHRIIRARKAFRKIWTQEMNQGGAML